MDLKPEQFPLTVMGNSIYGRMWSSPVLTAATPEAAQVACNMLNEMHRLAERVAREGPVLVGATPIDSFPVF